MSAQSGECESERLVNPFVHRLELETTSEKIKTWILTIFLVPIRVGLICFLVITGWFLATIGLIGLSQEELAEKPIEGWRKSFKSFIAKVINLVFWVSGFRLKIVGKPSTRWEAPLVALAPHSSFIDSIVMVYLKGPSIVAKGETAFIPFFGKIINYTQPIFVWRDDPESRQNSIKEIIRRANSDQDWPQILIFPEGTCTNRTCLITFRSGAFYPGVPVQPVLIRYPNKLDTITWTWEGPDAFKLLWLTLCQPKTMCELEFLPVYTPNEAERRDPKLYANNVRAVMAKALGVPTIDYSYYDCKLITTAKEMNLPFAASMIEIKNLRTRLGLENSQREEQIVNTNFACRDCNTVTFAEFCQLLNIPSNRVDALQLFRIYDKQNIGRIDIRDYLLGVIGTDPEQTKYNIIRIACKMYDSSKTGRLCADDFCRAVCQTMNLSKGYALELFDQVDRNQHGYISFEDFIFYCRRNEMFGFAITQDNNHYSQEENGKIIKNLTPYHFSNLKKRD